MKLNEIVQVGRWKTYNIPNERLLDNFVNNRDHVTSLVKYKGSKLPEFPKEKDKIVSKVKGNIVIEYCGVIDLEGLPNECYSFTMNDNLKLESLKGIPNKINNYFGLKIALNLHL